MLSGEKKVIDEIIAITCQLVAIYNKTDNLDERQYILNKLNANLRLSKQKGLEPITQVIRGALIEITRPKAVS